MLSDEQIDAATLSQWGEMKGQPLAAHRAYARAIEAEVRKQDTALIRQMLEALQLTAVGCRTLHHSKAEQHTYWDPCQPEAKYTTAITSACARLESNK